MIAAIKSQFSNLQICVLTGFRDFEYAREAIRLGVTRFLLKPSNMDELEEAIDVMCANLKKKGITGEETETVGTESASDHVRIEHAKELLKDPSLRIGDISEQVGFLDLAHFSRVFKKQEGMSANEYRNQILGK